jgi:hypothetical protein
MQGGGGAPPLPPRTGGSSRKARERRERAVTCEDDVDGGLEREGEGAWDLVWEVEEGGANLFREEWRLYIVGRGSTRRGDLRRERGRCRLTE